MGIKIEPKFDVSKIVETVIGSVGRLIKERSKGRNERCYKRLERRRVKREYRELRRRRK